MVTPFGKKENPLNCEKVRGMQVCATVLGMSCS